MLQAGRLPTLRMACVLGERVHAWARQRAHVADSAERGDVEDLRSGGTGEDKQQEQLGHDPSYWTRRTLV